MGFLDRLRSKGAPATPQETDQLVLRQLAGRGADLTKPRHVIHYLYFADEVNARDAAEVIDPSARREHELVAIRILHHARRTP